MNTICSLIASLPAVVGLGVSCLAAEELARVSPPAGLPGREVAPGVRLIGHIDNHRVTESSGVAASRRHPGVFWTHNDGGGAKRQVLFAMTREGKSLAAFPVTDVLVQDWEDIAADDRGNLFIGDIGNNDERRRELAVYQIAEPDPKHGGGAINPTRSWQLQFPGDPFDCESLFIWRDHGFVVSKVFNDRRAQIFRFPLKPEGGRVALELVATTKIDSPVTGADISADGGLLALVAKSGAFVYRIDGDVALSGKRKARQVKLRDEHIEGCCFVPEGLLATSESREIFLFTDDRFHPKAPARSPDIEID